jgi:WD40 repeat protein
MVYEPIGHGSYQFDGHASIQVFAACRATNQFFSNAPSPKKSSVLVWTHDAAGLQPPVLQTVLEGHTADVLSLEIAQDGSLLFSGSYDKTIRIWSTRSWTCAKVLQGHAGGVRALVASRDGKLLYSAAADNTIRVSPSFMLQATASMPVT